MKEITSRSPMISVFTTMLFAIAATHANASIVSFLNPPGAGHYDWAPPIDGALYLDVTMPPSSQPGGFATASTFEQTDGSGVVGVVTGQVGEANMQAGGGHSALLLPSLFGEAIPAEAPLPPNYAWASSKFITHPALGTNFVDGEQVYLGIRFDSDGGGDTWQHGWIGVVKTGSGLDAFAWAYETEVGVPIAAGAVPEPGTLAMLILGAGPLLLRSRRFSRQGS